MRLLTCALVLPVLIAGCANYVLPTDPQWHTDDGCRGVGLESVLRGSTSDPRVFWMVDRTTGQRAEIIWPAGYHARFDSGLDVLDDHNVPVGKEGDLIIGTCGGRGLGGPFRISSRDVRPPTWQPGDG